MEKVSHHKCVLTTFHFTLTRFVRFLARVPRAHISWSSIICFYETVRKTWEIYPFLNPLMQHQELMLRGQPFSRKKLKADRPHPRDYSTHRQTSWTDNDSSLLFAALGKAEPLNIKVIGQAVQPWERWRTDGRTDRRTDATNYIISLVSRSIINFRRPSPRKKQISVPMPRGRGDLKKKASASSTRKKKVSEKSVPDTPTMINGSSLRTNREKGLPGVGTLLIMTTPLISNVLPWFSC